MLRDIHNTKPKFLGISYPCYCVSELQHTQKATQRTQTNHTERWNANNLQRIYLILPCKYRIGHFVEYFDSGTNYSLAPA